MTEPIRIAHFSDILCIWAYIGQIRLTQLQETFPTQVVFDYHFVEIFGNTQEKLTKRWQARGGLAAYNQHVLSVAAKFDHIQVHPEIWTKDIPPSSTACHLFLHAIKLLEQNALIDSAKNLYAQAIWRCREAFFIDLANISQRSVLLAIAEDLKLPIAAIESEINSGAAFAQLVENLDRVKDYGVSVSPTLIFNEGRQRLSGNVGYRVIQANVQELLHNPPGELSWC
ncbi:DsbA family protein [Thermosynechococcaceae cyanobacterium BACA0444]|uniref:DsbA family protein n=1 Tax=Pseudocalidococcus azoricus BACA0444 TaxID=2918990 RepID=A0AAE4JWA0_9CYAN|nr:DsbA family protein [Pseudocalidococcus azoricus]MDS3861135.1 DsbA family protein [Pseudocalidococcus azoricus BACA0444]